MNQFRDLTMMALIILAFAIELTDPHDWMWAARGGPYVVNSLNFLGDYKPWSPIIMFALALALFMTRIKY